MTSPAKAVDAAPIREPEPELVPKRLLFGAIAGLLFLFACARTYQQLFAWSAGLDSSAPEFHAYWMNLFYAEIVIEAAVAAGLWSWLWRTRDRNLAAIAPDEELRRYMRLVSWLLLYVVAVFGAGFFAEQDATWHQTVVRDTEFTPSHIVLFFGAMPIFVIVGVSSYLYARTRIPLFAAGHSVPFLIAVAGPFLMLPNVGFNEWGHTFWIMEEIFSAPLHAGFVVFAWAALALGGILMQAIPRIIELVEALSRAHARSAAVRG